MKYLLILILLSGCTFKPCIKKTSHSCPKPGHGPCYLCEDPKKS